MAGLSEDGLRGADHRALHFWCFVLYSFFRRTDCDRATVELRYSPTASVATGSQWGYSQVPGGVQC